MLQRDLECLVLQRKRYEVLRKVRFGATEGRNGEGVVMVGVGNTAEVFDYGDGKVCKLFYEG